MPAADLVELDRHRFVSLAAFRRSGTQGATPVWLAAADGWLGRAWLEIQL